MLAEKKIRYMYAWLLVPVPTCRYMFRMYMLAVQLAACCIILNVLDLVPMAPLQV